MAPPRLVSIPTLASVRVWRGERAIESGAATLHQQVRWRVLGRWTLTLTLTGDAAKRGSRALVSKAMPSRRGRWSSVIPDFAAAGDDAGGWRTHHTTLMRCDGSCSSWYQSQLLQGRGWNHAPMLPC